MHHSKLFTSLALASSIALSACSIADEQSIASNTRNESLTQDATPEAYNGTFAGTNAEGSEALNRALQDMFDDESENSVGDMELSKSSLDNFDDTELKRARANYNEVLKNNPNNAEARFGHAFSGFALSFKTKAVTDMVAEMTDTENPIETFSGFNLNEETNNIDSQNYTARIMSRKLVSETKDDFPEMHEMQDVIDAAIIRAINESIVDLEIAYKDLNFSMEMTFDNRTRKVGHSEVGIMISGLKILKSILVWYVAWDFDIDQNGSYDFIEDLEGLDDNIDITEGVNNLTPKQTAALDHITGLLSLGSSMLTIRPGFETDLSQIDENLKSAAEITKASIASRPADSDFFINSIDLSDDEADEIMSVLDTIIKYSEENLVVDIPNSDLTMEIDFSKIFEQTDLKRNYPYYAFYPSNTWNQDNPVFYFTDAKGLKTGDVNTFQDIGDMDLGISATIDEVAKIIYFQDPTMQGILPNMTTEKIWSIIKALAAE
jgi:hypothetical protein